MAEGAYDVREREGLVRRSCTRRCSSALNCSAGEAGREGVGVVSGSLAGCLERAGDMGGAERNASVAATLRSLRSRGMRVA